MKEAAIQRGIAAYLAASLRPPTAWTAIGHGGGGKVRGAQLKAMGLKAGWPDLIVMHPNRGLIGLEIKTDIGRQSPEQKSVMREFTDAGGYYFICRSIDQVEAALLLCDIPVHAAKLRRVA